MDEAQPADIDELIRELAKADAQLAAAKETTKAAEVAERAAMSYRQHRSRLLDQEIERRLDLAQGTRDRRVREHEASIAEDAQEHEREAATMATQPARPPVDDPDAK